MSKYVGLDMTDVKALYRNRAAEIADGPKQDAPRVVVIVEFYDNREPLPIVLGNGADPSPRENLSIALDAASVLLEAAATCNAQASN